MSGAVTDRIDYIILQLFDTHERFNPLMSGAVTDRCNYGAGSLIRIIKCFNPLMSGAVTDRDTTPVSLKSEDMRVSIP